MVNNRYDKEERLDTILRQHSQEKILIFANTKVMCRDLAYQLKRLGYRVAEIHGDKKQDQRE